MPDGETNGTQPERPARERETSGQYLWRVFKPAGCIFFLLLFLVFMIFCFTWRGAPAEPEPTPTPTQGETAESGT